MEAGPLLDAVLHLVDLARQVAGRGARFHPASAGDVGDRALLGAGDDPDRGGGEGLQGGLDVAVLLLQRPGDLPHDLAQVVGRTGAALAVTRRRCRALLLGAPRGPLRAPWLADVHVPTVAGCATGQPAPSASAAADRRRTATSASRSEEHTSELQS